MTEERDRDTFKLNSIFGVYEIGEERFPGPLEITVLPGRGVKGIS